MTAFTGGDIDQHPMAYRRQHFELTHQVLHTGQPIPPQLVANVDNWDQRELTPDWLDSLPATVAEMCAKWRIELDPVIPETNITLVLLGHSAELGPVVIKSMPIADEFRSEATALKLAASLNVAKLYDVDFERNVMVIERIVPGTQLLNAGLSDEEATRLGPGRTSSVATMDARPFRLVTQFRFNRARFDPACTGDELVAARKVVSVLPPARRLSASQFAATSERGLGDHRSQGRGRRSGI
jgi:hypothetical protein